MTNGGCVMPVSSEGQPARLWFVTWIRWGRSSELHLRLISSTITSLSFFLSCSLLLPYPALLFPLSPCPSHSPRLYRLSFPSIKPIDPRANVIRRKKNMVYPSPFSGRGLNKEKRHANRGIHQPIGRLCPLVLIDSIKKRRYLPTRAMLAPIVWLFCLTSHNFK